MQFWANLGRSEAHEHGWLSGQIGAKMDEVTGSRPGRGEKNGTKTRQVSESAGDRVTEQDRMRTGKGD